MLLNFLQTLIDTLWEHNNNTNYSFRICWEPFEIIAVVGKLELPDIIDGQDTLAPSANTFDSDDLCLFAFIRRARAVCGA